MHFDSDSIPLYSYPRRTFFSCSWPAQPSRFVHATWLSWSRNVRITCIWEREFDSGTRVPFCQVTQWTGKRRFSIIFFRSVKVFSNVIYKYIYIRLLRGHVIYFLYPSTVIVFSLIKTYEHRRARFMLLLFSFSAETHVQSCALIVTILTHLAMAIYTVRYLLSQIVSLKSTMSDLDTPSKRSRLTHQSHEAQNDSGPEQNISSESQTIASFQNPNRECALPFTLLRRKQLSIHTTGSHTMSTPTTEQFLSDDSSANLPQINQTSNSSAAYFSTEACQSSAMNALNSKSKKRVYHSLVIASLFLKTRWQLQQTLFMNLVDTLLVTMTESTLVTNLF